MKTVRISAVRRIKTDAIDLVVLELANGKPAIVRKPAQFLNDLKNSFLIDENVGSMNHPQVRKALRNLRAGTVEGDMRFVKAGETWKVTAESNVMTDKNAKGYGQYQVGDMKEYEKDATIVEGFLILDLKEDAYQREENAQAYAKERVGVADAFDIPSDFNGGDDEDEDEDENKENDNDPKGKISKKALEEIGG